ncbi:glucose/galactose MFS transporter [Capnocytophaga sp. HP1101]
MNKQKKHTKAFLLIALLFFLFGGLTVFIQLLLPHLRDVFQLRYSDAGYILLSFFLPYLFFSIPAGFILTKIGYQRGIILGLLLISLGALLFYPAAQERLYWVFLTAIFILGSGVTFLQVAMNSYVVVLGDEATTSRRLTFSQAFNAIGTTIAPIFGAAYLLSNEVKKEAEIQALDTINKQMYFRGEALSMQLPFLYIALWVLALAFLFAIIKLPYAYRIKQNINKQEYQELLKKTPLLLGAIGIFLYVGSEVVLGSYTVNYFIDMNITKDILESPSMHFIVDTLGSLVGKPHLTTADPKAVVAVFISFYWGGAMLGRFISAYLIKWIPPAKVLIVFAILAISLILFSINTGGLISMWSLLSIGLFNSIMFPTIFALACEGIDEFKPQASAILCTMIVGGGLIPLLYGILTDSIGFRLAFLTLVGCYSYIAFFGFYKSNR